MYNDPATVALHADGDIAELPDIAPAIRPATTFARDSTARFYRRDSHETTERLEAVLGALEGGSAVAYPSGMAAVAAILRHIRPRRIALPEDVYHGVRALVGREALHGTWQITTTDALGKGDVWWVETPSNPKCLITDVAEVATMAHSRGVHVVVDATFATPVLLRSLDLGADFVVHAATKFIAGHSDAMGGVAVSVDDEVAAELRDARRDDGAVPGALETWLALRGVRSLPLRVERQSGSALAIAEHLTGRVPRVWYPGLPGHPGHDVAVRQMAAFGGVLSFEVESEAHAARLVKALRVFRNATSLGGVESLAEHRIEADAKAPKGLIRLSVGLESPVDLIADLDQAMLTSGVDP
jgi:cystathionine gamma-synthase